VTSPKPPKIISHFPSGEMVFNSYTPFAICAVHHSPGTKTVADLIKFPGFKDPHEPGNLEPQTETGRGNPAQPAPCPDSIEAWPVLPAAGTQQIMVPKRNHHPAVPLLDPTTNQFARLGRTDVVRALLDTGLPVEPREWSGFTPLGQAAMHRSADTTRGGTSTQSVACPRSYVCVDRRLRRW
jgi:hypothetical protein